MDAIIYFVGYDSCAGNWFHNSSPQNISIRQFDTTPTQSCEVTTIELAYVAGGFEVFFAFCDSKS